MASAIEHRGPDDEGIWLDRESGIGLGHRRLSIVDLSPSGHQPMLSPDGRYVLNYNGEIYNHRALRAEVEAAGAAPVGGWRGHSDTEVLLAAISAWGLEAALEKAVGMFALALWDALEPDPDACPRPLRREAALLWLGRQGLPVRLRAEGAAGSPAVRQPVEPARAAPVRRARLRSGAAVDLRAHLQAAAGMHSDGHPRGLRSSAHRSAG